jgi:hypothetical protein
MKTPLLLFIAVMSLLCSCDKEIKKIKENEKSENTKEETAPPVQVPQSFAGTYWMGEAEIQFTGERLPIGEHRKIELTFNSDKEVTCFVTQTYPSGVYGYTFSGTYEYEHPNIMFQDVEYDLRQLHGGMCVIGNENWTVTDNIMTIGMLLGTDVAQFIEFRKQAQP